jgi:hypothetical protein
MQALIVVLAIAVLVPVSGFYLSGIVIHPRTRTYEDTCRTECEKGNMSKEAFDSLWENSSMK